MSAHSPVKPGDVLAGKFKVERVLGVGGMGMVVAAKHLQLGQRVALKFMLPEGLKDHEQVERFEREARAAVQLKSEHVARVSDVGKLKNGAPYMVMEYLEGRDLGAILTEQGHLPIPFAIDLILQASEAIAEAHALGIVHRDIKLKNLFLTRRVDGRPLVKVLDFGLAKASIGGAPIGLTQTATVFGSPQYMSPEQMRSAKDVDVRSDVWALGVCLYELVTGSVPFDAPTLPELCAMVLKDPPRPVEQLRADCPPDLARVIMRCLEKDPNFRYQNVAELARDLEGFAAPHAHGSADRIFTVLSQTRTNAIADSQSIDANVVDPFDPTGGTKTAAVFDSIQDRPRKGRAVWIGAGAAGLILFAGVVGVGIRVGTRHAASGNAASGGGTGASPVGTTTATSTATATTTAAATAPGAATTTALASPAATTPLRDATAASTNPKQPPKQPAQKPAAIGKPTPPPPPTATAAATATATATATAPPPAPTPKPTPTTPNFNSL